MTIDIRDVTKVFGTGDRTRIVLDGVSLSVERGQIAAVVGPSGAGKSTLARCINLLERPTSGSISVDGANLADMRPSELHKARRAIGTIFQASSLLMRRTAADNIALPLECIGMGRAARRVRVAELLDLVGLTDHADAFPRQLSGGQRQRVDIARALALRPSVLLSDEATSGLDPTTTRSILNLLEQLRDELDLTIVLITHEMSVVRAIADHVTLLERGRVVESGLVADVVSDADSRLGNGLLPEGPVAPIPAGGQAWQVTYTADDVPGDWVGRLSRELGVNVSLLGGTLEFIGGKSAGRMTISITPPTTRVVETLALWGLHAQAIDSREVPAQTESAA